jgi:phosphate transport system substrate-binding protein
MHDGISVILHPSNPLSDLTLQQVRDIYNGNIINWKELGWIDRRIDAVTREEGSGTRSAFEELVMKKNEIDDSIMVQDSNGSVKEVVATDPYAMVYFSMGLLDEKVKSVAINSVVPTIKNIKTGRYRIVRPFLYVTNGELDPSAKEFVEFILSKDGQKILRKEGLVGFYD